MTRAVRAGRTFTVSCMHASWPRFVFLAKWRKKGLQRVCEDVRIRHGPTSCDSVQGRRSAVLSRALRSVFCPGEYTMLVRDLLHTKGNRVISIDSAATVHEAV